VGLPADDDFADPFQVLITPEEVLIVNGYNETRHIYTDGRPHPPAEDLWPSVTGNSVGHWEGDTLVIDTIMVTNPNEFFQGGPPLSEQAHYVERIWLDGEALRAEMTIEDPVTLSAPWKARLSWVRGRRVFDRMIRSTGTTGPHGSRGDVKPSSRLQTRGKHNETILQRFACSWRWRPLSGTCDAQGPAGSLRTPGRHRRDPGVCRLGRRPVGRPWSGPMSSRHDQPPGRAQAAVRAGAEQLDHQGLARTAVVGPVAVRRPAPARSR
jgi:hypothetical protein